MERQKTAVARSARAPWALIRAMLCTGRDGIPPHRAVFSRLERTPFKGSFGWMCLHVITLHFWTFSRRGRRLEGLVLQLLPSRV